MSTLPPPPRPPLTTEQVVGIERNAAFDAEETAPTLAFVRERGLATLQLVAEWRAMKKQVGALQELRDAWDALDKVEETNDIPPKVDAMTGALVAAIETVRVPEVPHG
jgi:hypothetical protein